MACSQSVINKWLAATKNTMAIKKTSGGVCVSVENEIMEKTKRDIPLENSVANKNLMRHVLRGDFPDGLVYSKIEIHISKYSLKIKFLSLEDESLLGEFESATREGDVVELLGVVASYRLSFLEL
jgi:hypothetical protein